MRETVADIALIKRALLDPLADYLRARYHTLAVFGERPGYAVLERN